MNCVLCGQVIKGYGHNPEPVAAFEDGRCCDDCNNNVVIPTRIQDMRDAGAEVVDDGA